MRRTVVAGTLATALLVAVPAVAQEWDMLRDMLLEMLGDTLAMDGYAYAGFAHEGSLAQGESEDVPIRLGPGLDFVVIGECDGDCYDLDLALYDLSSNEIASDSMADEFPLIETSPAHNALYRLRVSMAGCHVASCRYAVQSMARAQGRPV